MRAHTGKSIEQWPKIVLRMGHILNDILRALDRLRHFPSQRRKRLSEVLLLWCSLMIRRPPAGLLRDFPSWVEGLDTAERFLEDVVGRLDERSDVFDERFFVEFFFFLVAFGTSESLWRIRQFQSK